MEKKSPRFYDIRFGILIAIIVSILLFKYFTGQPLKPVTIQPASTHQQMNDSLHRPSPQTNNASAH